MCTRRRLMQVTGAFAFGYSGIGYSVETGKDKFKPYPFDPISPQHFTQKLFIPVAGGPFGILDATGPLKIRATAASFPLLPGPKSQKSSPFLLYQTEQAGKAYQNPILRMESGARFTASLHNELQEPTIIHWHGLHTPAAMNGHPSTTIGPGGHYDYDFVVRNRGDTYWHHTLVRSLTIKQAYDGLTTFFLVDDEDQLNISKVLDLQLGVTDLPLVVQDKQLDKQGKLVYKPNMHEAMMDWLSDIILSNLMVNAVQTVTPRTCHLRLLNGSNVRSYRPAFVKGDTPLNFIVIGTDGGLIERPEYVADAFFAPGARVKCAEVVGHKW